VVDFVVETPIVIHPHLENRQNLYRYEFFLFDSDSPLDGIQTIRCLFSISFSMPQVVVTQRMLREEKKEQPILVLPIQVYFENPPFL